MTEEEVKADKEHIDWTEADKQRLSDYCDAYLEDNKSFNFHNIAAVMGNKSARDCSCQYFLDHQEEEENPKEPKKPKKPSSKQVFGISHFATFYTDMFLTI
jgi:hypothetical protein